MTSCCCCLPQLFLQCGSRSCLASMNRAKPVTSNLIPMMHSMTVLIEPHPLAHNELYSTRHSTTIANNLVNSDRRYLGYLDNLIRKYYDYFLVSICCQQYVQCPNSMFPGYWGRHSKILMNVVAAVHQVIIPDSNSSCCRPHCDVSLYVYWKSTIFSISSIYLSLKYYQYRHYRHHYYFD